MQQDRQHDERELGPPGKERPQSDDEDHDESYQRYGDLERRRRQLEPGQKG